MMRFGLLFLFVLVTTARAANNETVMLQGVAQGTTWHVKFVAPAKGFDSKDLQADIEKKLSEIDREMSTYRDDSEISRFNRATAGKWFAVSRAVAEVVVASREISEKTSGAQDITVGPLVRLWHFGAKQGGDAKPQAVKPPGDEEIQAARKLVGYK